MLRAYGKTPELSSVLAFSKNVEEGKEAFVYLLSSPIWVACRPEKVSKYLVSFTKEYTAIDYIQ